MTVVWYILIHVTLGIIGKDWFAFTNLGAILCALAGAVVQGYAMWEIHRLAWPRFRASPAASAPGEAGARARRGYWGRLGRTYIFRISAFSMLTLLVAAVLRGAEG